MYIEVHAPEKKAVPRRALLATVLLMVATTSMAGYLVWLRSNSPLSVIFDPPGWSITFQAPRGFLPIYNHQRNKLGTSFRFYNEKPDGTRVMIMVIRVNPDFGNNPETLCNRILGNFTPKSLLIMGGHREDRADIKIGPIDAHEVWDEYLGIIVRAGILSEDDYYAVLIRSSDKIKPDLYEIFDQVCNSIKLR